MHNIMVVDDAIFMRNVIKKILVSHRYKVVAEASTGREAVQQYKAVKPNLVLMDITMPEQNGTEAVREIIEFDPSAVVVMCSAMGQEVMVVEAITNGAKGFIVKPFDKDVVIETVSKLIGVPPVEEETVKVDDPGTTSPPKVQNEADTAAEDEKSDSSNMSSLERRLRHELRAQ